jgi:hypothetical protein
MHTHATPSRRILTAAALALHQQDGCPPKCRLCGQPLREGDYVDCQHPYDHDGNLHKRCEEKPVR